MNENIDIQIFSQKKEVKGAAIQGSSLISTFEEVRNLLQSGQPIFVNGHEYSTHQTKLPSAWPAGCIELSSDYQHGSDYSAAIEFEIYAKPKVKKEKKKGPVIMSDQKDAASAIENKGESKANAHSNKEKPATIKKLQKVITPRSIKIQPPAPSEIRTTPRVICVESSAIVGGNLKDNEKEAKEKSDQSVHNHVASGKKMAEPGKVFGKNIISTPLVVPPKLRPNSDNESKQEVNSTKAEEVLTPIEESEVTQCESTTNNIEISKVFMSEEERIRHAQQLALRRTALRKKQLDEKEKADKEKQDEMLRNKLQRTEQMRLKLLNKAQERLKEYEESKRQEEIEKKEEYFEKLEQHQASEELVQSEEYQKKVKQLRIDAKKRYAILLFVCCMWCIINNSFCRDLCRLKKFKTLEEQRYKEEENKRQMTLLQHTNRIRAPLPSVSSSTTSSLCKKGSGPSENSLLSTLSLFSNHWNQQTKPHLHPSTSEVIYEETEDEVDGEDGEGGNQNEINEDCEVELTQESPPFSTKKFSHYTSRDYQVEKGNENENNIHLALPVPIHNPIIAFTLAEASPVRSTHSHSDLEIHEEDSLLNHHHNAQSTPTRQDTSRPGTAEEESVCEDNDSLYASPVHKSSAKSSSVKYETDDSSSGFSSDDDANDWRFGSTASIRHHHPSPMHSDAAPINKRFISTNNSKNSNPRGQLRAVEQSITSSIRTPARPGINPNQENKSRMQAPVSKKKERVKAVSSADLQDNMSDLSDYDGYDLYDKEDSPIVSAKQTNKLPSIITRNNHIPDVALSSSSAKKLKSNENFDYVGNSITLCATTTATTTIKTTTLLNRSPTEHKNSDQTNGIQKTGFSPPKNHSPNERYEEKQFTCDQSHDDSIVKKKRKPFRKLPPIPIAPYNPLPLQLN